MPKALRRSWITALRREMAADSSRKERERQTELKIADQETKKERAADPDSPKSAKAKRRERHAQELALRNSKFVSTGAYKPPNTETAPNTSSSKNEAITGNDSGCDGDVESDADNTRLQIRRPIAP